MSGVSRNAQHYDIVVTSAPRAAPVQSLTAIVKAFAAACERGEAIWRRGPSAFEIARVRFNKPATRAILLLRHADTNGEASAHLVIDLASSTGAYHAILEHAEGLTKARVEQGVQALANKLFEFYFKGPGGSFGKGQPRLSFTPSAIVPLATERAIDASEIRPDISAKLDALLRQRALKRAA